MSLEKPRGMMHFHIPRKCDICEESVFHMIVLDGKTMCGACFARTHLGRKEDEE